MSQTEFYKYILAPFEISLVSKIDSTRCLRSLWKNFVRYTLLNHDYFFHFIKAVAERERET